MPQYEWKHASVDLSADVTTIESVPCLVKNALVTTVLSAHVCPIQDHTTVVAAFAASAAVGAEINFSDKDGVRFENSLVVDPHNSATGVISVRYRRLREH